MKILGLDPGLQTTGWGLIEVTGNHLRHLAHGTVKSRAERSLAERLCEIHSALLLLVREHRPDEAAVEETFVNKNPASTLKLGQARGVVLLAPALCGVPVAEYAANYVKKSLVGVGHAEKTQMRAMVQILLPGALVESADAADALAVAICHAHSRTPPQLRAVRPAVVAPAGAAR